MTESRTAISPTERMLTANDVDNVVNAIVGTHGGLTVDMKLALLTFEC